MLDLMNILLQFKDETIALIDCLEVEEYDSLAALLDKRQALIDKLNNSTYNKHLFKELCEDYEINDLNSKLNDIMTEKINSIKSEIKKIELQKNINSNYTMNTSVDSIFFNKKI